MPRYKRNLRLSRAYCEGWYGSPATNPYPAGSPAYDAYEEGALRDSTIYNGCGGALATLPDPTPVLWQTELTVEANSNGMEYGYDEQTDFGSVSPKVVGSGYSIVAIKGTVFGKVSIYINNWNQPEWHSLQILKDNVVVWEGLKENINFDNSNVDNLIVGWSFGWTDWQSTVPASENPYTLRMIAPP